MSAKYTEFMIEKYADELTYHESMSEKVVKEVWLRVRVRVRG